MGKHPATPIWINVTSSLIPVPVGTTVDIEIGWLSPEAAGTGYLNVIITQSDGSLRAIPVGVLAPTATDMVQFTCTVIGMTEVRVHEDTGRKWTDLGAFFDFAVA